MSVTPNFHINKIFLLYKKGIIGQFITFPDIETEDSLGNLLECVLDMVLFVEVEKLVEN